MQAERALLASTRRSALSHETKNCFKVPPARALMPDRSRVCRLVAHSLSPSLSCLLWLAHADHGRAHQSARQRTRDCSRDAALRCELCRASLLAPLEGTFMLLRAWRLLFLPRSLSALCIFFSSESERAIFFFSCVCVVLVLASRACAHISFACLLCCGDAAVLTRVRRACACVRARARACMATSCSSAEECSRPPSTPYVQAFLSFVRALVLRFSPSSHSCWKRSLSVARRLRCLSSLFFAFCSSFARTLS